MYKTLGLFILTLMFTAAGDALCAPGDGIIDNDWSVSEQQGVYCEVNGVRLYAKTAEDCQKSSGEVTHVINTKVTPVSESANPN